MKAKQKALYVIHRRVDNKYPYMSRKQSWAITFALFNRAIKRKQNGSFVGR